MKFMEFYVRQFRVFILGGLYLTIFFLAFNTQAATIFQNTTNGGQESTATIGWNLFPTTLYSTCNSIPNWLITSLSVDIAGGPVDATNIQAFLYRGSGGNSVIYATSTNSVALILANSATTTRNFTFVSELTTRDVCSGGSIVEFTAHWINFRVNAGTGSFRANWNSADGNTNIRTRVNSGEFIGEPIGAIYGTDYGTGFSMRFILPTSGETGQDFRNWIVELSPDATSTYERIVKINYGRNSGIYSFIDSRSSSSTNMGSFQLSIPKINQLASTTWYARAYTYENGINVANTSEISFTINAHTEPFIDPFLAISGGYSTSTPACDPNNNFLVFGFCRVMVGLFYPSPKLLAKFVNDYEDLQTKFPFSFFFTLNQTLQNQTTTASSSPSIIYTAVNFTGGTLLDNTGTAASTTIFNVNTYQTHSVLTRLRDILGTLIYMSFAIFLFFRLKHFV